MENNTLQVTDKKLKLLKDLGEFVSNLQKNISTTPNNLPTAYIDPQVILEEMVANADEKDNMIFSNETIAIATTQIDFLDGLPVINGLPFWERLDCEPLEYYRLFKTYRDMKLTDPTRSFEKLNKDTNTETSYLYALSKIYHWSQRVKAFDLYQLTLIEKARTRQVEVMEGKHKKAAERIFEICTTYLEVMEETGLLAAVSPKEMQGWAELAIKLERLSLGLSPDKPITNEDTEKIKNVINFTNIETQQNQQNMNQLNVNNPIKGLSDTERNKFLQEVANTLLIASPEVIFEKNGNEQTNNSESNDEPRVIVVESEADTKVE